MFLPKFRILRITFIISTFLFDNFLNEISNTILAVDHFHVFFIIISVLQHLVIFFVTVFWASPKIILHIITPIISSLNLRFLSYLHFLFNQRTFLFLKLFMWSHTFGISLEVCKIWYHHQSVKAVASSRSWLRFISTDSSSSG